MKRMIEWWRRTLQQLNEVALLWDQDPLERLEGRIRNLEDLANRNSKRDSPAS
jgi:hypothetical protein